eukprot:3411058-Rhodomonas_salina.1
MITCTSHAGQRALHTDRNLHQTIACIAHRDNVLRAEGKATDSEPKISEIPDDADAVACKPRLVARCCSFARP